MDKIVRNHLNEALLIEGEKRGFRPYIDSLKARDNDRTPGFYMGSIQKRVTDDAGTRYFVNIDMFNMSSFSSDHPGGISSRSWVQFYVGGEGDEVADVSMSFDGFEKTETFFDDMWQNMKFGYYEKD